MTITPELIREHGLSDEEYARIKALLGATPIWWSWASSA